MTYALAKIVYEEFERQQKEASAALRAIPGVGSGPMGLTPDAVKFSPEYRAAKARCDAVAKAAKPFFLNFAKQYKKEIIAERDARRAQAREVAQMRAQL